MTFAHDPLADRLNDWLDSGAGAMSTAPGSGPADDDLASLAAVARRFHDSADREASRMLAALDHRRHKEQTMQAIANGSFGATNSPEAVPEATPTTGWRPVVTRVQAYVSLAAVLVLLVGLAAFTMQRLAGPNEPGTIPVGNQFVHESTPEPQGQVDPATLPKAEDCTIEPLTVDEVIAYTKDPTTTMNANYLRTAPDATPVLPANGEYYGTATQATLDDAAKTQRMWMACVLAESWFRIWATEAPRLVQEQVLGVTGPVIGEDELRAMLIELEANGTVQVPAMGERPAMPWWVYTGCAGPREILLIDTTPDNSWQSLDPTSLTTHYTVYDKSGTILFLPRRLYGIGEGTPISNEAIWASNGEASNTFHFQYNFTQGMWMVSEFPGCG